MKCPNCGGQMGLEDAKCPYCGTPNAMAAQHQSDMARFQREYQRTQESVMEKASFLQRQGSWLIVLSVLLVALIGGIVLKVCAWDIGYAIRVKNVESSAVEDHRTMDAYLELGDYGKFAGYYDANGISLDYDSPYQQLHTAADAYADLLQYVSALNDSTSYRFDSGYIDTTCRHIASDLDRIYGVSYDTDSRLPADKRVYLNDLRERTAVIAKVYFGLDDDDIENISNVSQQRLALMIEGGIAS